MAQEIVDQFMHEDVFSVMKVYVRHRDVSVTPAKEYASAESVTPLMVVIGNVREIVVLI